MKIAIIGSGPGGYVAAIRCAQLGHEVSLIERYKTLGGTCLNVGCIPSKALLDSSEHYHKLQTEFEVHGIKTVETRIDFNQMIKRKSEVVSQNVKGIDYLMKKNKIKLIQAYASFAGNNLLKIEFENGATDELKFDKCIIATGSKPNIPKGLTFDKRRIISSTEALELSEIPKKLIVIGAGVIGLELGSVFARLGTEVSVVEYADRILPGMDDECSKELQKVLAKLKISFYLACRVEEIINEGNKKVLVKFASDKKAGDQFLEADYCLIATGRRPFTDGLQVDKASIKMDERGFILVNDQLQTANPDVYAIGDVIGGAMLAHKAEEEGIAVAERISGQKPHINYSLIPSVVYTWPEFAAVGYTEDQLKQQGRLYKIGKFPFKALGRARASMDLEGLVKIIVDSDSDEILGVHILGARAADLIMEAVALMEFRACAEDLALISHPHPTYSEALKEAALQACGKGSIHS